MTLRRGPLLALGLLVLLFLFLTVSVGGARRRAHLLWLRATGGLPDVSWGDVVAMMPPRSGYDVEGLLNLRNPYAAIENPLHNSWDVAAGQTAFRSSCAPCHGRDAQGGAGPDLTTEQYRHGASDWALYRTIMRGVPGTAMQAHPLPRTTIWQLVAYLRSVRQGVRSNLQAGVAVPDVSIAELDRNPLHRTAPAPALPPVAPAVTAELLRNAGASPANWLTYSGTFNGHRRSGLEEITRGNASRLKPKWVFPLPSGRSKSETSPIVVGSTMFVTSPTAEVHALDVRTGALLWSYTARTLPDDLKLCCGLHNRGVAVLGHSLFLGTLDAHLIALDARTGAVQWETEVADYHDGYSITAAPLVVEDRVIIGVAGGEFGIRGFVDAYDARTGHRLWRFYTVPAPGEPGHETWGGDSWKAGGAPTWMTGTYDPDLKLLYWGVGNPGPNYQGDVRPGDNLYANSVLALDVTTGQLRWHFQFTPHDEHDWDATQTPILADLMFGGQHRKLLLEANRNGFYYVLDRQTGAFLMARPFVHQTWTDGLDAAGRPKVRPDSRPSPRGSMVYPGDAGGTNWWAPSFDPSGQVLYVQVRERAGIFFNTPDPKPDPDGWYMGSIGQSPLDLPNYLAVRALDASTGSLLWEYRPEGGNVDAGVGGLLSTAGGLVFGGCNSTFFALSAKTGKELWKMQLGGAIWAAPVSYLADGVQQVTVAAGDRLITFSVDGR
jgi:alcohol dehydrogenase (cytochrome c)